jgi:lysylphosphatidylglycerol synthetase-like protein (DUF2156 family)
MLTSGLRDAFEGACCILVRFALLLLYCCFTAALLLLTSGLRDAFEGAWCILVRFALLLLYCCFTAALLLLYCCFTASYFRPSGYRQGSVLHSRTKYE